jgi:hypothetical protein
LPASPPGLTDLSALEHDQLDVKLTRFLLALCAVLDAGLYSTCNICYTQQMSTLSDEQAASLRSERDQLLEELSRLCLLIHGSYFERYSTCSRSGCACHEGRRHGPRGYVALRSAGRPGQHYVPRSQVSAVQKGVEQYHRLLQVADRITEVNLQLMRGGRLDEQGDRQERGAEHKAPPAAAAEGTCEP